MIPTIRPPSSLPSALSLFPNKNGLAGAIAALDQALSSAQQAVPSFETWLPSVSRHLRWDWPYIRYIRAQLDAVTAGTCKRLLICTPPRHGKSTLTTIHYPAYRIVHDPRLRMAVACYNQTLAEKFSRRIRTIARGSGLEIDPERRAVDDWLTTAGGGVRAAGVGGGITGQGFDGILIDDPVKSREEANSASYRARCWDWYKEDLYSRLEPGGWVVLILTRWHQDDLAGRILESEQAHDWTVIRLPAEAEADDPLGRAIGEALCPARYDLAALADIRRTLTELPYAALYQQRPMPVGGGLFKDARVGVVGAVPAGALYCRGWDIAASAGARADWTCGILMARTGYGANQRYYLVDVVRGQWETDERDRMIRKTADADAARYGHVTHWLPQDPGAAGKSQGVAFVRLLAGHSVVVGVNTGAKDVRADPFSAQWNAGDGAEQWNVALVAGIWHRDLLGQFLSFPYGKHDDLVDAASSAFNWLAAAPVRSGQGAVGGERATIHPAAGGTGSLRRDPALRPTGRDPALYTHQR